MSHPDIPPITPAVPREADNPIFDQTIPQTDQPISDVLTDAPTQAKDKASGLLKGLGQNKRAKSGVRALTNKDRDAITQLYVWAGFGVMAINGKTAVAMADNAERCADAWMEVAAKNDNVRRVLLGMLEGGAWGKVIMAHMPILLTLLPPEVTSRFTPPQGHPDDAEAETE